MELSLNTGRDLIVIIASYALGCFSTGYYLMRIRTGQDIRKLGSGSSGGRNVGRVLGKQGFIVTVMGDLLKGAIALQIAYCFNLSQWGASIVMPAVVLGHIYPVQLRFHGGKGLATALGTILMFSFQLTIILTALTILLGSLSRQLTLSLMVIIATTPVIAIIVGHTPIEIVGLAMTALLIIMAHRTNILTAFKRIAGRIHQSWQR